MVGQKKSLGKLIRALLGPLEKHACDMYRAVFVNVERCARKIAVALPQGARVLDVGGGDGAFVDALLRFRPDVKITMIDLRDSIGLFIAPERRECINMVPSTSLREFASTTPERFDAILAFDVVHHVPVDERREFYTDCVALAREGGVFIVKDIEPAGFIAWLSKVADWYITGDSHVEQIRATNLRSNLSETGHFQHLSDLLGNSELPNYAHSFRVSLDRSVHK
jgi:2-polyprenyl-3-methyl-5-hydroxy-6-metoxy-1,4-benzoquinol methylase